MASRANAGTARDVARRERLRTASTAAGRALALASDTAAQRTALGLGTAAVENADAFTAAEIDPSGWAGFLAGCTATNVQDVLDWIDANK